MSARRDELTEPAMDAAIERACTILRLPTVRDRHGDVAGIAQRRECHVLADSTGELRLEERPFRIGIIRIIAALRHERIAAPFLVDGPVDTEVFTAYLQQVLGPCLHPGDTLILDNLATHKIQSVGLILSDRGVSLRYLPPYSPDLNPIELAFAKLKAHLRQAAARTLEELQSAVANSLDRFSAADCKAFFRHAQYASI